MTLPPPEPASLADTFRAALLAQATAKAQATYFKTLVAEGVEPDRAQEMTSRALTDILGNSAAIVNAVGDAAAGLAPVITAVTKLAETPLIEGVLSGLREEARR